MRHNTKLSSTNAFGKLNPDQTRQVEQWLFEDNLSYDEILKRSKEEFNIEASSKPLFKFHRHLLQQRTADRIVQNVEGKNPPPNFEVVAAVGIGRSALRKLTPEQAKKVEQWLFEDNLSQAEIIRRCESDFRIKTSYEGVAQFFRAAVQHRTINRLRDNAEVATKIGKTCAETAVEICPDTRKDLFDAVLKGVAKVIFHKINKGIDSADHATIFNYSKILNTARREDLHELRLQFDREKWEFDVAEACLKKLPGLKAVESSKTIPYKEKIRRIRMQLFGCAPD
jgi:hypothetical protein